MVEFVNVLAEVTRREKELVPDILHRDHHVVLLRKGDQLADLPLGTFPGLLVRRVRAHHRGHEQDSVGAE